MSEKKRKWHKENQFFKKEVRVRGLNRFFQKKLKQGKVRTNIFFEKKLCNFQVCSFTLRNSIQNKVLPLEYPQNCLLEISHDFVLITPGNSTSFFLKFSCPKNMFPEIISEHNSKIFLQLHLFIPCCVKSYFETHSSMQKFFLQLQEKEEEKDYSMQKICLERTYSSRMSVNSRLKDTKIIGQRKAFYRQKTPESSCARK